MTWLELIPNGFMATVKFIGIQAARLRGASRTNEAAGGMR